MMDKEGTTAMAQFTRYIGIDYSGVETADSSCKGLRVFMAEGSSTPEQVQPPPSPRRYWTRRGLAEWLCGTICCGFHVLWVAAYFKCQRKRHAAIARTVMNPA